MVLEMKVPSPGESITEVEIATWLVSDGDYVEKDQIIAELDSDKATLELPAEEGGVITLKAQEGDAVDVGQVVCLIDTSKEGEARKSSKTESKDEIVLSKIEEPTSTTKSEILSPAAKKIVAENNFNISDIIGTGKDGRITKQDILIAKPSMGSLSNEKRDVKRTKLSLLRRKVAERLVSVKNETAMLTTFNEVDMSAIFALRKKYKEKFKTKHDVNLGFMSFFTLASVRALKEFPAVNSMIDGNEMITYDYCDISIAVSGPKGLMVPVIRHAEKLSFREIEIQVKTLAERARDSKITVDEMTGGTFTISNGGVFGSMLSTPIINPPQSAILGMHNIIERPIAVNGKVEIRPVMYLALSYDHRIIDGRESVGFLVAIKEALENPSEILMGNNILKSLEL
ncbi:MAG: 2-oxoglutarate dehydrogenase complex dihydrolipoyllysine-residue succinyltransferase [Flavobacteriales bacterium]|jgi:2-oxoglutarate dehydrogenase E2 component (dihydrolipoamide succinyltransferase)|nr:2-oxoglutarate dehydrogenase complex dihydrolipoyllysine-residue succinyltransferase [Flavobacteriaceae bacterium]RZP06858.1 MAG: 2-oxoglutarate dehydrogenase complex dihydrolipoyllysine-residue succinyltransferase [Flavobacteriales bacterium]